MSNYIFSRVESENINELEQFYANYSVEDRNYLEFDFENELFFKVVNEENQIVGIGSVSNDAYTYANLKKFIIPEMRGKKIADFLLDEIIKDAKNEKKTRLTGSFKLENEKAKKYLTGKGFKIIPFDQNYYSALLKINK